MTHFALLSKIMLLDTVDIRQIFPRIKYPNRIFSNIGLMPKIQTVPPLLYSMLTFSLEICHPFK